MKFNVATFFWILPNAIISDFKTYFQLISKDMLVHTWKTKSYFFFLKRYRCWDMLFWKLFGFEVRKFRSVCGKLKVTISKLSGECNFCICFSKIFGKDSKDLSWLKIVFPSDLISFWNYRFYFVSWECASKSNGNCFQLFPWYMNFDYTNV